MSYQRKILVKNEILKTIRTYNVRKMNLLYQDGTSFAGYTQLAYYLNHDNSHAIRLENTDLALRAYKKTPDDKFLYWQLFYAGYRARAVERALSEYDKQVIFNAFRMQYLRQH